MAVRVASRIGQNVLLRNCPHSPILTHMTKPKSVRVTAILTAEQYNALVEKSEKTDVPMTALIRRLIEKGLKPKSPDLVVR